MNSVNKTLYIPLYGKAYVSKKGIILLDRKAEEIWAAEGFSLKGKSKSKWLAYYMGMRAAVFDKWLLEQLKEEKDAVVIHIGCGMDSRVVRVGTKRCLDIKSSNDIGNHISVGNTWYDVDFPEVIAERKRYYSENSEYHMIASDVRAKDWLEKIPAKSNAVVVMEGVSMYMQPEELQQVFVNLAAYFAQVTILMDYYTTFAAKASKYKNPINDVGVTKVYGLDEPRLLETEQGVAFVKEHEMTPEVYVNELKGMERIIFKKIFAGEISRRMYRLYEYKK